eukprot:1769077-Rhodomonas_salina.1
MRDQNERTGTGLEREAGCWCFLGGGGRRGEEKKKKERKCGLGVGHGVRERLGGYGVRIKGCKQGVARSPYRTPSARAPTGVCLSFF